jgi:DNA-binding MltR family transcriptional regulator
MVDDSDRLSEIRELISQMSEKFLEHLAETASAISDLQPKVTLLATSTHSHITIMGATGLDNALELAILTKMRNLGRDMKDRIFDGYGPLSSFAAKIDVAYALQIIPQEFYDSLRIINRIRVKFAHSKQFLSFQDNEISSMIDSLPSLDLTIADRKDRFVKIIAELKTHLEGLSVTNDQPNVT